MKKILSLILAVVMSLSVISVYAEDSAADISYEISDINDAERLLGALGIIDGSSDYTRKVTRIEFLRAVGKALKLSGGAGASFTDVTGDDYSIASAAVKLGIISDAADFNPEREVTANEAYKMAVVATGYAMEAVTRGGYPAGYVFAAQSTGISDDVMISGEETLSYADFVIIIRNMCETDIKYQTAFGETQEYTITKGKNIITSYHHLEHIEGMIDSDFFGSLYDKNVKTSKGCIAIGDKEYKYDGDYILGSYVKGYKTDKDVIVYMQADEQKLMEIDAEDIISTENSKISYETDGKEKSAKLISSPAIIYNGISSDNIRSVEQIDITNGSVTLLDNDSNGVYDIVFVNEYYNMYISKVNTKGDAIYDKNDGSLSVNVPEDDDAEVKVISNSNVIDIKSIAKSSAAQVYKSEDSMKIKVVVSANKLSGNVEGVDSGNKTVTIKGTEYKITDYFEKYYLGSAMSYDRANFILNENMELVAIDSPEDNMMVGIIVDAGSNSGLDGNHMLKIYDENGEIKIYDLADKVSVDALGKESSTQVMEKYIAPMVLDGEEDENKAAKIPERFILFAVNGDEEIVKIDTIFTAEERANGNTPRPGDTEESVYPQTLLTGDEHPDDRLRVKVIDTASQKYKMNIIKGEVALSSDTMVVKFNTDENVNENQRFSITDRTEFRDDQSFKSGEAIYAYNMGDSLTAEYVLYASAATGASTTGAGGVVEKVSRGTNPDGNDAIKIIVYNDSNLFETLYVDEAIYNATPAESGDMIRYGANSNGIVTGLVIDYDFSEDAIATDSKKGYNSEIDYYKGFIYSTVPEDTFIIFADNTGYRSLAPEADIEAADKKVLFTWGYTAEYDCATGKVKRIKNADIISYKEDMSECDYAVMRQSWAQGKLTVVYRNLDKLK